MSDQLQKIQDELREIRRLLQTPPARPDDLVDANYIASRLSCAERTVLDGKAGTNAIPRVNLKAEGAKRGLIRFPRAAADRFVTELTRSAQSPKERARLYLTKPTRRKKTA